MVLTAGHIEDAAARFTFSTAVQSHCVKLNVRFSSASAKTEHTFHADGYGAGR